VAHHGKAILHSYEIHDFESFWSSQQKKTLQKMGSNESRSYRVRQAQLAQKLGQNLAPFFGASPLLTRAQILNIRVQPLRQIDSGKVKKM
jgi:hypothetical protein